MRIEFDGIRVAIALFQHVKMEANMEPTSGTHFNASCRLPHWKGACSIWVKTIEFLCLNFGYADAPWEYLERTNSAILAGCLTQNEVPAMPETYVMRKGAEGWDKRVDICLVTRNSNTTTLELVECKQTEYDASRQITIRRIQSNMKAAFKQVENITAIHNIEIMSMPSNVTVKRTGAVIGLPCFLPGTSLPVMENAIQQIIRDLKAASMLDVLAWCFPEQYLGAPSKHWPPKVYPGTFLAIQALSDS